MKDEKVLDANVVRPIYYRKDRAYEPKDVISAFQLNFNLGNVVKYIARAGRKDGESVEKDYSKAKTYLGFELLELGKYKPCEVYKRSVQIPADIYQRYVNSVLMDWELLGSGFEPVLRHVFATSKFMFVDDISKELQEAYDWMDHILNEDKEGAM